MGRGRYERKCMGGYLRLKLRACMIPGIAMRMSKGQKAQAIKGVGEGHHH